MLWKNYPRYQLYRIGQLFLVSTNGVMRPVQVISRSFSHDGACCSPLVSSLRFKSSRNLFFSRCIAGATISSMNCKSTQCYSCTLLSKYAHSQAHQHGLVIDVLPTRCSYNAINNLVNCKATVHCRKILSKRVLAQFRRGLMLDTLPANRADRNEQTRNTPMDIEELVEFLRDENARDICVIRVPPQLDYVDYFVVCSGFGGRHLRRMADGLVAEVYMAC